MNNIDHMEHPQTDPQTTGQTADPALEEQVRRLYDRWLEESDALALLYSDFDLKEALTDSGFCRLLQAGVPMQQAYEVQHLEQIKSAAMEEGARHAREALVARRPSENGVSRGSAVALGRDVRALDKKAREELIRRAARGEQITF